MRDTGTCILVLVHTCINSSVAPRVARLCGSLPALNKIARLCFAQLWHPCALNLCPTCAPRRGPEELEAPATGGVDLPRAKAAEHAQRGARARQAEQAEQKLQGAFSRGCGQRGADLGLLHAVQSRPSRERPAARPRCRCCSSCCATLAKSSATLTRHPPRAPTGQGQQPPRSRDTGQGGT